MDGAITEVWVGDESLRPLLVNVELLEQHRRNPRRGDVDRISASLQRFGQVRPIVATHEGTIIAGNHTYQAARKLGWTHVACVRIRMSDKDADAYLVADNRLSDIARWQDDALEDLLGQLQSDGFLDGTGWTTDEVDELLARGVEEDVEPEPEPEEREEMPKIPGGTEPHREVVLSYRPGEHTEFEATVSFLERALETRGVSETVFAAIKKLAEIEGRGGSEPF